MNLFLLIAIEIAAAFSCKNAMQPGSVKFNEQDVVDLPQRLPCTLTTPAPAAGPEMICSFSNEPVYRCKISFIRSKNVVSANQAEISLFKTVKDNNQITVRRQGYSNNMFVFDGISERKKMESKPLQDEITAICADGMAELRGTPELYSIFNISEFPGSEGMDSCEHEVQDNVIRAVCRMQDGHSCVISASLVEPMMSVWIELKKGGELVKRTTFTNHQHLIKQGKNVALAMSLFKFPEAVSHGCAPP